MSTPAASRFDVVREPDLVPFDNGAPDEPIDLNSTRAPHAPAASSENRSLPPQSEQWNRFCAHCGNPVPWERLVKAITRKAKVFFCTDLHRFADANAKTKAAKKLRQAKGYALAVMDAVTRV